MPGEAKSSVLRALLSAPLFYELCSRRPRNEGNPGAKELCLGGGVAAAAATAMSLTLQIRALAGPGLMGVASVLTLIGLQRTQRWRVSGATFTRRFFLVVISAFLVNCLALIAVRVAA